MKRLVVIVALRYMWGKQQRRDSKYPMPEFRAALKSIL